MLGTRGRIGPAAYIPPRRIMYGTRRRFGEIRLLARLCRAVTDSHVANGEAGGGFPLYVDFYRSVSDFIGRATRGPRVRLANRHGLARTTAPRAAAPCRTRPPAPEIC